MVWFEIVTRDGARVIAEAEGLLAARYAAFVLLAEEPYGELAVHVAGEPHPLEVHRLTPSGLPAWRGSTLSRRYEP